MVAGIGHELKTLLAYAKAVFELIRDRACPSTYIAQSPEAEI